MNAYLVEIESREEHDWIKSKGNACMQTALRALDGCGHFFLFN